jgi:hypothetical protein
MVMRLALSRRTGEPWSISQSIPNTALIELPATADQATGG